MRNTKHPCFRPIVHAVSLYTGILDVPGLQGTYEAYYNLSSAQLRANFPDIGADQRAIFSNTTLVTAQETRPGFTASDVSGFPDPPFRGV